LIFSHFVIPSDPESRLGDGSREEQKMLAFTELFLRHQVEHMLYPEHKEREVIQADVDFAQDRRRKVEWEGGTLSVISPEGLIALKSLRNSGQDRDDIDYLRTIIDED
jgi:hypothetical protein